jgi:hypothetical protein
MMNYQPTEDQTEPILWEVTSHSATWELPNILWNPKVYYDVQWSLPLVPIISQMDPIHNTPYYSSKICLNITSLYFLVFLVILFLLSFPTKPFMHASPPPCRLYALPISFFVTQ